MAGIIPNDDLVEVTFTMTQSEADWLMEQIEVYRELRESDPVWPSDDAFDMEDAAREIADVLTNNVGKDVR